MFRPPREHWHGLLDSINALLNNPHIGEKNMGNKFVSWLEDAGKKFAHGLLAVLHIAESGQVRAAVGLFLPQLGLPFNITMGAIVAAEQKYAALGKQTGTGPQKLADVLQIAEPVIAQALADMGKTHDTPAVIAYINNVVGVLNAAPAPPPQPES